MTPAESERRFRLLDPEDQDFINDMIERLWVADTARRVAEAKAAGFDAEVIPFPVRK